MAIVRIEELIYGVDDFAACARFFDDAGLDQVAANDTAVSFCTPVGQLLHFRRSDDPMLPPLPPAAASGPNIREIIWGVDAPADLDALEREHIERVLVKAQSEKDAARILGIDVSTLYRKRKKFTAPGG